MEAQCSSRRAKRRRRVVGTSARMGPLAERFATAPCRASSRLAEARSSAHPGASLSLSRSRNGTPSRGSATFLNNACVHIILFKSHLERESSILQPCAPEFCWKTLQNISPSGRGQVRGGRPHRAGVRRAAKRQRESLRSLTGRREEDPDPPIGSAPQRELPILASARAYPPSRVFGREENRKATSGGLSSFSSEA